jgi:hypothetical protein
MTTLQNVTKIVDVTHLVGPPSELERAREHLRISQLNLFEIRRVHKGSQPWLDQAKSRVLAALSWVWDAQERDAAWQVWIGALKLADALREAIPEPQTLIVRDSPELREMIRDWQKSPTGQGLFVDRDRVTLASEPATQPRADRFYRSPRRPTRRAAAPASRGRRRRS